MRGPTLHVNPDNSNVILIKMNADMMFNEMDYIIQREKRSVIFIK